MGSGASTNQSKRTMKNLENARKSRRVTRVEVNIENLKLGNGCSDSQIVGTKVTGNAASTKRPVLCNGMVAEYPIRRTSTERKRRSKNRRDSMRVLKDAHKRELVEHKVTSKSDLLEEETDGYINDKAHAIATTSFPSLEGGASHPKIGEKERGGLSCFLDWATDVGKDAGILCRHSVKRLSNSSSSGLAQVRRLSTSSFEKVRRMSSRRSNQKMHNST